MEKLKLVVCENSACEVKKALKLVNPDNIELISYPATGCFSNKKNDKLGDWCENFGFEDSSSVVMCSSACSILNEIPDSRKSQILKSSHCLEFIFGRNILNEYIRQGGYIVNCGWLKNWSFHLSEMGFDKETAKLFFNETCNKIVLLDACGFDTTVEQLKDFAKYVNLPYEIIEAEIDYLVSKIETIQAEYKHNNLQKKINENNQEIAEYATIFDIIARLAKFNSESDVLGELKSTLSMLYAPKEIIYWDNDLDDMSHFENFLLDPSIKFEYINNKSGFIFKVTHDHKVLGIFELRNILMPEYIDRYVKSTLIMADALGLALSNAKNYQQIIEAKIRFDETIRKAEQISKIGIFEIDWMSSTEYWSNGIYAILGKKSNSDLLFKEVISCIHKDDLHYVNENLQRAKICKDLISLEFRIINERKETVYIDCILRTTFNQKNQLLATTGVCRNVTAIKLLQKENMKMEVRLAEKSRIESLGTLASGFAHEINNPLNGIMNYGQLILDSIDHKHDVYEFAKEIVNESNRVSKIVNTIMQFSEQEYQPRRKVSIEHLMDGVTIAVNTELERDEIKFNIYVDEKISEITCCVSQIQNILINIIQNSINSLNAKSLSIKDEKYIDINFIKITKEDKPYIRIEIEDNGAGIEKEIKTKIFEPFFSTLTKDKAKGLGLSYSKKIAEEHHGDLTFESYINDYTKFYLDLPLNGDSV